MRYGSLSFLYNKQAELFYKIDLPKQDSVCAYMNVGCNPMLPGEGFDAGVSKQPGLIDPYLAWLVTSIYE